MADILEIKRALVARVDTVAEYLLPGGRREGHEWRCGSVEGQPGKSLAVELRGEKAGVWADFGTEESGDILDLWRCARGVPLAEAVDEARQWLGMERPQPAREPKREYARPEKPKCNAPQARVLDYLREDRNVPHEIIERYRIGEQGDRIVFPFVLPDGTLALVKTRKAEDEATPMPTSKNFEPVLFGWHAMPENARELVLTEGEIDALSWAAYGWPAMSVPSGGGGGAKQQWIENEFDRMERFERIYLATDMDEPGDQAAEEIASRLGRHRCFRVHMPHKDANDCLVAGVPKEKMDSFIAGATALDPEGLRKASDFAGDVIRLFWPEAEAHVGYRMPYRRVGDRLLFRPAEMTLWSGASGSGKSQILSDCIVDWIAQNSRVCLSSLEMKPHQTLKRMCKQVIGVDRPSEQAIRDALSWMDRGLLLYERVGKSGVDGLMEIFAYARAKYGCDQFVIDSLMRLGIASDDYDGQEQAVFRLVDWAIANSVHVHLVAHSRKANNERKHAPAETEDIKGPMELGANAFNILTIWRYRELEETIKKLENQPESEERNARLEEERAKPGVILNVAKQRNGDFEGKVGLFFDQETYRYRSSRSAGVLERDYLGAQEKAA